MLNVSFDVKNLVQLKGNKIDNPTVGGAASLLLTSSKQSVFVVKYHNY